MKYSSRFWLFAPLVLFFALAAFAMTHWWLLASALDRKLIALNGKEAAPGVTLHYTSKTISGFPFNIDIVFTGFVAEGQGAHGPFRWTTEKFALHRLVFGRIQDLYEAAGQQTFSWTDGSGKSHALKFLPGSLRASAIGDDNGLARFDLEMIAASGTDSDGTVFSSADSQLHLRRDTKTDTMDVMLRGDDIKSAAPIAGLFGNRIKTLRIYATLTKGSAFTNLLAGKQSAAEASANWQAKGGQAQIGPVAIQSSGLNLSANAFDDSGNDLRGVLSPLF